MKSDLNEPKKSTKKVEEKGQELSYKEIADVMGCPVGTVMSRLHRARKMLQVTLRDQAVALGIVEPLEEKRAAVGDPNAPVDLQKFRSRQRGEK